MLDRPDQVYMESFFSHRSAVSDKAGGCGTAGCIAGFLAFRSRKRCKTLEDAANYDNTAGSAIKYAGLTKPQAIRLFYIQNWPVRFFKAYQAQKRNGAVAVASVVVKRIEHFIKTQGRQ
jgi:hypothetical protein